MVTTAAILIIVACAKTFGKAIALYRIPQDISYFISSNIDTKAFFMVVVCLILVAMGLVFETLSMVIMVECALITPPVGLNLYVIQSVAKTQLGEVAKGVFPFLIMMIFTVFVMYIWTDLALYIPFKL